MLEYQPDEVTRTSKIQQFLGGDWELKSEFHSVKSIDRMHQ
jgi:hypothetical protein